MADAISPQLEKLLTEAQWVRGLAQRLAAPGHEADDLVQDAWLAALESTRSSIHSSPFRERRC